MQSFKNVNTNLKKMAEAFSNVFVLKYQNFILFLTALGGVQKSYRSLHFSSCTPRSQRELGNDIGIQIIHCSKFVFLPQGVYAGHTVPVY